MYIKLVVAFHWQLFHFMLQTEIHYLYRTIFQLRKIITIRKKNNQES